MCKFKLFSIAAAALMMVACSNEDLTQQTQTKAGKMQFSATIAAPSSGATTRTIYTEDTQNKKITVAWKVDDEIALVHNGVKDVATVKTINSDGSATITGYVTGATNNADVRLVYPAARVGTVTGGADGTEYTADETVEGKLKTQGGTLAYIQDNLDFREDMGQLAVSETGVTLAEKAGDISPLLAIWKLTLSDGTNNLSATQVKIKGGESVLASTTTLATATSVVTLAIPTDVYIDGALTIEATVGDDTYAYTKAEVATFIPGTYYQSTVTMTKKIPATVTTAPTATASVTAGSTTALVTAGVADGGTMMYAVTTTNTKPTSTTGFSATIPTSEGIVTEGTYYVWYYVKADGSHTDSAISASAVSVTVTVVLANGITLSKTETIINYWSTTPTETLTATVTPDDASNKNVTWSSDNEAVATVNATTGEISSVAPGTANITARTTDGTDLTKTCTVTVYNNYLQTPGRGTTVYMTFGENAPTHSGTIYFTGAVTTSSDSNSIAYRHYLHGSYDRLSFKGVDFYSGGWNVPAALYISGGTGTESDPYVLSTP